jgi:hypothetical protein
MGKSWENPGNIEYIHEGFWLGKSYKMELLGGITSHLKNI